MSRIPDLVIERVHLGEATEAERARVLADPDARARLEALGSADAALLSAHPADAALPAIERELHVARTRDAVASRNRTLGIAGTLLVPLVAAALAFAVLGPTPTLDTEPVVDAVDGVVRPKGPKPKLHLYRMKSTGAEAINTGIVLRRGDRVQVGYTSGDATHGVIVSVDGRGTVTLHLPGEAGADTRLTPGRHAAPDAYELDDAPQFERFFLVAADHELDAARIVAAAEALAASGDALDGDLQVSDEVVVKSFLVRKEER